MMSNPTCAVAPGLRTRAPEWARSGDYVTPGTLALSAVIDEPATMSEALSGEHAELWKQAMADEIASLLANNTWSLEFPPRNATPIPVKWVYKVKRDSAGNIERFKARLVAKGFKQQHGIDYNEVFAPVSKYATFRAVMAAVASNDLEMLQIDIKTAFLNGTLEEEIYICQPPGYENGDRKLACHLHKALYGLKQAPRAWHQCLNDQAKPQTHGHGFSNHIWSGVWKPLCDLTKPFSGLVGW